MSETSTAMRMGAFVLKPSSVDVALHRFRHAEAAGYDAVFATHVNSHEATVLMAAAAAQTERIRIGVGVIPIYSRSPATMAQTAATLQELSHGRLMLGLGLGHRLVMERWHGATIAHPAPEMREYLAIMRAILDGDPPPETTRWAGDMPLVGMGTFPGLPLLVGALGPAMLRMAGEVADGVVLWMCPPSYVRDHVVPLVREGRERAGKTMEGFDVVASIPCAVTDDAGALRRTYVKQVLHNLRLPFYRGVLERGGYHEDLAVIAEVGTYEELGEPADPEALDALARGRLVADIAAVGDAAVVAERLADYEAAGVTIAGINPVRIDDFDATLDAARRARDGGT